MNKVILIGNLCTDVVPKIINGTDKKVIHNSVAVKRNFKNKQGEYESDFINIVVYEPHANYMENYIKKGDKVALSGRWQHRTYESQQGTRYIDELVVESIELIKSNATKEAQTQPRYEQPTLTGKDTFVQSDFDKSMKMVDIDQDELPFY